eukprot:TRINITY_DN11069_c0_g1_i1.p1 TRINITY_DN11069_c0_g1~~TRINITY_DN11069_c0_g1_i1.p1  ORF type:complete len:222 (+),score=29.11 TRINITY_DN11069_c0_g1_i1:1-666(+)
MCIRDRYGDMVEILLFHVMVPLGETTQALNFVECSTNLPKEKLGEFRDRLIINQSQEKPKNQRAFATEYVPPTQGLQDHVSIDDVPSPPNEVETIETKSSLNPSASKYDRCIQYLINHVVHNDYRSRVLSHGKRLKAFANYLNRYLIRNRGLAWVSLLVAIPFILYLQRRGLFLLFKRRFNALWLCFNDLWEMGFNFNGAPIGGVNLERSGRTPLRIVANR